MTVRGEGSDTSKLGGLVPNGITVMIEPRDGEESIQAREGED